MRPSTSMQAQFRPISPRPPRKTTRTGAAAAGAGGTGVRGASWPAPWRPPWGTGPPLGDWPPLGDCASSWRRRGGGRTRRPGRSQATERPAGDGLTEPGDDGARLARRGQAGASGLGSRHWPTGSPRARQAALAGTGLGYVGSRFEGVGLRAGAGWPSGPPPCRRRSNGRDHLGEHRAGPVGGHADDPHAPDRQEGQGERVVPAVDLEAVDVARPPPGRHRPRPRWRPSPPRCWAPRAARWTSRSVPIRRPVRTGMS